MLVEYYFAKPSSLTASNKAICENKIMISRKEFFGVAAGKTISFLMDALAPKADAQRLSTPPDTLSEEVLYEAMALGIDPATLDAEQLRRAIVEARGSPPTASSE